MIKDKKAQFSLEYIGTYTFIITMTVAFIALIFYFDLFNTEKYISQYCIFDSNFYCYDYAIRISGTDKFNMTILLQNNMDEIIDINQTRLFDQDQTEIICDKFLIFCRYNETNPYATASPSSNKVTRINNMYWTPTRLCSLVYKDCEMQVFKNTKQKINVELNFSGYGRNYTHFSYGTVYANVLPENKNGIGVHKPK